ncbi:unnamed protein product (macronuclear) [Paramecium tetraurelia]|uniref:Uncharacterized protein n=1 Tax=Paramecium tetraurelia TaxID=5888 RepID=A0E700_PARTE|nr:uncharacterized protein GSPATT00023795001 [Paramecium tetraurelia]CAK91067.1 unnamed protein product [Paramecium tetraurelia]|eukprot:XP_001458464.1 hypothetical protein (macronuclear) [Paramecium tetraurelia strain d4-2]
MQRSWLEQPQRTLDINFDIKSIRNQVKDRCVPVLQYQTDSAQKSFYSYRKESLPTVPSFENLQAKIRDFSYTKLNQASSFQQKNQIADKSITYSPQKAAGLQKNSLGSRNNSNYQSSRQQSPAYQSRPIELSYRSQQRRNLSDNLQLNEIVSMRNKIESSQASRSLLGSNYVSELVKLAQAITNALK